MPKLKAGLVGAGRIGLQLEFTDKLRAKPCTHYGMLRNHPDIDLVAVIDPAPTRIERFSYMFPSVDDAVKAIPDFDILTVATPTPTHFEIGMKVAKHTRLLFMEKPITETVDQALNLIEECKKHDTILVVNHTRRWHPYWCRVRSAMDEPCKLLIGKFSGGWIHDGIHMFDIINWFSPSGFKLINYSDYNLPAIVFEAELYSDNLAIKVSDFSTQIAYIKDSNVYEGYKQYDWPGPPAQFIPPPPNPWKYIATDLVNTLQGKQAPACTGEDGLRALLHTLAPIGRPLTAI